MSIQFNQFSLLGFPILQKLVPTVSFPWIFNFPDKLFANTTGHANLLPIDTKDGFFPVALFPFLPLRIEGGAAVLGRVLNWEAVPPVVKSDQIRN